MKKNTSNPLKKCSALFALPGICLFLWSFSEPEYVVKNSDHTSEKDISMHNGEFEVVITNGILSVNGIKESPLILLNGDISDKNLHEIDTKNFQSMTTLTTDQATEKYGTNGQNGAIEITTRQNDKMLVQVETTTSTEADSHTIIEEKIEHQEDTTQIKKPFAEIDFWNSNPDVLVIIDGEKSKEGLNMLEPEEIESISVLKKQASTGVYGEEGKNGVIIITTKKNPFNDTRITPEKTDTSLNDLAKVVDYGSIYTTNSSNTPLCFVDGQKTDSLQNIDPNEIHSISVLKGKSATKIYGDESKHGVILITTKRGWAESGNSKD